MPIAILFCYQDVVVWWPPLILIIHLSHCPLRSPSFICYTYFWPSEINWENASLSILPQLSSSKYSHYWIMLYLYPRQHPCMFSKDVLKTVNKNQADSFYLFFSRLKKKLYLYFKFLFIVPALGWLLLNPHQIQRNSLWLCSA